MRRTFLLLLAALLAVGALAADPRPMILVIGDDNSAGFGFAAPWTTVMGKLHPEWNLAVNTDSKRRLADITAKLDDILAPYERLNAVLVFTGVVDSQAANYQTADATALGTQMSELLAKLKAHPKTQGATLCVLTPGPVIEARLDQWSKTAYAGGEAHCDAIAAAFAQAARDAGVGVIDAHKLMKEDTDVRGPGKLVGSIGWRIRDWGIPMLAKMLEPEIVRVVNPQPSDPAAFAAWQAERAGQRTLDAILAETSEGIVNHGDALDVKTVPAKAEYAEVTVPVELLSGDAVSLLLTAAQTPWATVGTGGDRYARPVLLVTCEDKTQVKIDLPDAAWQCLSEEQPTATVDPFLFRFNAVKERFAMGLRNQDGKRIWGLVRFPLSALQGKKPVSAVAQFIYVGFVELNYGATDRRPLGGATGPIAAYPVLGADGNWDDAAATWKSRDGVVGWSGGQVDAAARRARLTAFLATPQPAPVAERAQAELAKLK